MEYKGIWGNCGLWTCWLAQVHLGAGRGGRRLSMSCFVLKQIRIFQQQIPAEDPASRIRPAKIKYRASLRKAGAETRHWAGRSRAAGSCSVSSILAVSAPLRSSPFCHSSHPSHRREQLWQAFANFSAPLCSSPLGYPRARNSIARTNAKETLFKDE